MTSYKINLIVGFSTHLFLHHINNIFGIQDPNTTIYIVPDTPSIQVKGFPC